MANGLDQRKFEEMIAEAGKLVTWRAGYKCSCWLDSSGAPNYQCKACDGRGYVYQAPHTVHALMTGIDVKRDFLPAGEWRLGDITCSVPNMLREFYPLDPPKQGQGIRWKPNPMWEIGEADLVTLPDSEQRTSEVLVRGTTIWRRPADTLLHGPEAILRVLQLFVSNPDTGAVTVYLPGVEGEDYTIEDNVAVWDESSFADYAVIKNRVFFNPSGDNAAELPEGAQYSVTYTHLTTYIVYQGLPMPRDHFGKMPRKVILRLRGVGVQ